MKHWIERARELADAVAGSPYRGGSSDEARRRAERDLQALGRDLTPDRFEVLVRLLRDGDPSAVAIAETWDAGNRKELIAEVRKAKNAGRGGYAHSWQVDTKGLRAALVEILGEAEPGGHAELYAIRALAEHGDDLDSICEYLRVPLCVECDDPGWEQPPGGSWTCAGCAAGTAGAV